MEPASCIGIASAALSVIAKLGPTIISIKESWDGVKNIEEFNNGFVEELDAFQFSLAVVDVELRKDSSPIIGSDWWNGSRITDLLTNSVKTVTRLDLVFKDVARKRRMLQSVRSYVRSCMYKEEVGHLMTRLRTYTTCLNLPAVILAVYV